MSVRCGENISYNSLIFFRSMGQSATKMRSSKPFSMCISWRWDWFAIFYFLFLEWLKLNGFRQLMHFWKIMMRRIGELLQTVAGSFSSIPFSFFHFKLNCLFLLSCQTVLCFLSFQCTKFPLISLLFSLTFFFYFATFHFSFSSFSVCRLFLFFSLIFSLLLFLLFPSLLSLQNGNQNAVLLLHHNWPWSLIPFHGHVCNCTPPYCGQLW